MSYAHTECAAVFSENSSTLLRTHHPKCQLCWDENASDIYGKKKVGPKCLKNFCRSVQLFGPKRLCRKYMSLRAQETTEVIWPSRYEQTYRFYQVDYELILSSIYPFDHVHSTTVMFSILFLTLNMFTSFTCQIPNCKTHGFFFLLLR